MAHGGNSQLGASFSLQHYNGEQGGSRVTVEKRFWYLGSLPPFSIVCEPGEQSKRGRRSAMHESVSKMCLCRTASVRPARSRQSQCC